MMLEHASVIDHERSSALKPSHPGKRALRGEDVTNGETVLPRGTVSVHRIWGRWPISRRIVRTSRLQGRAWRNPLDEDEKSRSGRPTPSSRPNPGHPRPTLIGLIAEAGRRRFTGGSSPDDREALRRAIGSALDFADIVVLSGKLSRREGHDARSVERDGQAGGSSSRRLDPPGLGAGGEHGREARLWTPRQSGGSCPHVRVVRPSPLSSWAGELGTVPLSADGPGVARHASSMGREDLSASA